MRITGYWSLMLLLFFIGIAVTAGDVICVGPGDKPGEGTRGNPYTFTQAFSGSAGAAVRIKPGSTVYLLGGSYKPEWANSQEKSKASVQKVFHIEIQGEPGNPICIIPSQETPSISMDVLRSTVPIYAFPILK